MPDGVSLKIQRQLYGRVARRANERVSDGLCLKQQFGNWLFLQRSPRGFRTKISPPPPLSPATVAPAGSGGPYGHLTKICCGRVIKMAYSSRKTFGGPLSCLSSKSLRNIFVHSFRMGGQRYFIPSLAQIEPLNLSEIPIWQKDELTNIFYAFTSETS